MPRHRYWTTVTLVGTTLSAALLWADTPVKPMQASFPSKKTPAVQPMTVEQAELLVSIDDKEKPPVVENTPAQVKTPVVEKQPAPAPVAEKKPVIDYPIKAASVEVAWLQDSSTFPLHLRAETKQGMEMIILTGYVPSERMKEKAVHIARSTVGNLAVQDLLIVHPMMVVADDSPTDPQQAKLVQDHLERMVPGVGKTLHIIVDSSGIATIHGRVDEFTDRQKIIRALQGFPGCTAVRYELRVNAPAQVNVASNVRGVSTASANSNAAFVPMVSLVPVVPAAVELKTTPATIEVKLAPAGKKELIVLPSLPTPPKQVSPPAAVKDVPVVTKKSSERSALTLAGAIIQAGCIEPLNNTPTEKVAASSLSGLFPPGMSGRCDEPVVMLGSPVIVRMSHAIVLDIEPPKMELKQCDISQSSTVHQVQAVMEPLPMPINIMPRQGK